jgi:hypothetical protein
MNAQQAGTSSKTGRNWTIFLLLSIYLIASFLWRAFTPAHEYPRPTERFLTMGIDLLCVIGLVGLRKQVAKGDVVFWIALAAGIGLFAIRLNGDASWATGHLVYFLTPR